MRYKEMVRVLDCVVAGAKQTGRKESTYINMDTQPLMRQRKRDAKFFCRGGRDIRCIDE